MCSFDHTAVFVVARKKKHVPSDKRGKTCNQYQEMENIKKRGNSFNRRQAPENMYPVTGAGIHAAGAKREKIFGRQISITLVFFFLLIG